MQRIEINVETGTQRTVNLTAEEIAELQALPPLEVPKPQTLTTEQKLAAAGLTVDELRELLGLA